MWELSDQNQLHFAAKKKICEFCECEDKVEMSRTAERDIALTRITKRGILESVLLHIKCGRCVHGDYMDNGDLAYIIAECAIEKITLYVKVKLFFSRKHNEERMFIISAHPSRRW